MAAESSGVVAQSPRGARKEKSAVAAWPRNWNAPSAKARRGALEFAYRVATAGRPLEPMRVRRFREVEAALGVKLEEILAAGQPTRTAEREKLRKAVGTGVAANAVAATEARAGTASAPKRTAARRAKRPAQRRST